MTRQQRQDPDDSPRPRPHTSRPEPAALVGLRPLIIAWKCINSAIVKTEV